MWGALAGRLACAEYAYAVGGSPQRVDALVNGCFTEKINFVPAYSLRAQINLDKGRLSQALSDAERILRIVPE